MKSRLTRKALRSGRGLGRVLILMGITLPALCTSLPPAPVYTAQGIVNAVTQTATALAPNSLATIYGTYLAFNTSAAESVPGSVLPSTINGVSVLVEGQYAHLLYISPSQINFLIPYNLVAGTVTVEVARLGLAGPSVKIQLHSTAPSLFPWNGNFAIAAHLSGALISPDAPAKSGEIILLYVAGLGRVTPDTTSGRLESSAFRITAAADLKVLLGGKAVAAANVLYAGLAPGFAGLYQVNLRLPDDLAANPEIRISVGTEISAPNLLLPAVASPAVIAVP